MNHQLLKDGLIWGFALWLFGYVLGIVLFMFVPASLIGWVITPIGLILTTFTLLKKIDGPLGHYLKIGIIWTIIAIVFDYFFLVKLFKPADGYYKPDVFFYYLSTFALPLIVGIRRQVKDYS